ncbi:MAG: MFS transporter [Proteobacteria bacterium]|nr:MFS transporter [Pseudomonadota bacterium]
MNRSESDSPTAKSVSLDTAGTAMPPSSSKPSRAAVGAVFGAGVAQGIALVTFPAAGAIFTSPQHYGLSSTQYGMLFVPQAIMAIISSLLGPTLARSLGAKNVFLAGMLANLLSMGLLIASQFLIANHTAAYAVLLLATTCMGLAFGLTVPVINTCAAAFFPAVADRALLTLNTLLGLGTALAPAFVAVFTGLGFWWGLPVLVAGLCSGLLVFSLPLTISTGAASDAPQSRPSGLPPLFPAFAAAAFLYGICETMNGNWASIFMSSTLSNTPATASLALTVFWATVTGGRLLFASIDRWIPEREVFRFLPVVITISFFLTPLLPEKAALPGLAAFALAGLGCSAMLPLLISFGQKQMPSIAASVAGGMIAFYQLGYGIAAFGVGPLENMASLSLNHIFAATAVPAIGLAVLAFVIARRD